MQGRFVNLCYTMENHAIATMMTSFGSTDHGLGTEVDSAGWGTSSKNRLELPLLETYLYLTDFGKTMILAWVPSHVAIRGNQMANTLAKEVTKMITTLKLPFSDYKTKIKHYIRRKWQTIWNISPNNKLYEHQPTVKVEIAEPLPNRRRHKQNQNWTHIPNTCLLA